MQKSSKLLFRTAIVLLGLMLAVTVLVSINSQKASALDSTQWDTVRGYVESYFTGQYDSARGGEAGIIKGKLDLADDLNNDGDADTVLASYLDEGDDMATRPVLIDNLGANQTNVVPGTEFRCTWSTDQSCFSDASVQMVKELVDAHKAAGFSTEIVDYCVSSHTASPTTAGFGIIAQTGGYSSDGDIPVVKELEWSRNGWTNTSTGMVAADGNQAIAGPETSTGYANPTAPTAPANCEAEVDNVGLVSCQANWAIAATLGNVSNGQSSIATIAGAGQTVDVRPGAISTLSTAGDNLQVPMDTLFSLSGIHNLDPLKTTIVASNTQHGGQTAMGLKMLGYNMVLGGYINSGVSRWEYSTGGEIWAPIGNALPKATVATMPAPGKVDTSQPVISGTASVSGIGDNVATIGGWTTGTEPTTIKVELGTTAGVYTTAQYNTVLHADHAAYPINLTGLAAGTHYYYRVTDFDSFANASTTQLTGEFDTTGGVPVDTTAPSIDSIVPSGYLTSVDADVAVYYSDSGSGVNPASVNIMWYGPDTDLTASCTVYTDFASCPQTGLPQGSHIIGVSLSDNAGNPATGSGTVFVDNRTPSVMSGYYPASNAKINNASPTIAFTAYDRLASGYTDPATVSGLNASTIAVTLDGAPLSCTVDLVTGATSCPTAGLTEGLHSWTYTFSDNAGNIGTRARSFTVDLTGPTITSIVPAGYSTSADADVAVYYNDASGINVASVNVYWYGPDVDITASCGVYADYASCPQTGLPQGSHNIGVSVADSAGNVTTGTGNVFIDTYAPSAGSMYPRNNYTTTPAAITATLRDSTGPGWPAGSASGVDYSAPVTVTLDGTEVTGCSINTGTGALSCAITGTLAEGSHTTVITLSDIAGNTGSSSRSFVIDTSTGQPDISLGAPAARWGSYADYLARTLSIDWAITNNGVNSAYSVSMTNVSNTNGVVISGSATASYGTILAGASTTKTLKYTIPSDVTWWKTVNSATAKDGMGTSYSYGG